MRPASSTIGTYPLNSQRGSCDRDMHSFHLLTHSLRNWARSQARERKRVQGSSCLLGMTNRKQNNYNALGLLCYGKVSRAMTAQKSCPTLSGDLMEGLTWAGAHVKWDLSQSPLDSQRVGGGGWGTDHVKGNGEENRREKQAGSGRTEAGD